MTRQDLQRQLLQRPDLHLGKIAVAVFVTRIDQLDADRALVHADLAFPAGLAGVPGGLVLGDQLVDRAVLVDQVMGTDLGFRVAQPVDGRLRRAHAGIVQDEQIDVETRRTGGKVRRLPVGDHAVLPVVRAARAFSASRIWIMATPVKVIKPPMASFVVTGSPLIQMLKNMPSMGGAIMNGTMVVTG